MAPIPPVRVYTWAQEDEKLLKQSQLQDRLFKTAVIVLITIPLLLLLSSCACAKTMRASYYSHASLIKEGTRKPNEPQIMANGKRFNQNRMTCASRDYPLGAVLRVTNKVNGRSVVVTVTDRISKRMAGKRIDLSKKSFSMIADLKEGLVSVTIKRLT